MKKQLAANMSAAIYCRLSRDDENVGESESMQNQRAMLTDYPTHRDLPSIPNIAMMAIPASILNVRISKE